MVAATIGITTGGSPEDPEEGYKSYASYAEAIQEAGGNFRFLDPKPATPEVVAEDLEGIQGLLLTGGVDIYPDYYPSRDNPGDEGMTIEELLSTYRMRCNRTRDVYEIPLARMAYSARLPILGICRGFQLLNVALGGGLIKDICTGPKHWAYRQEEKEEGNPGESRKHLVTLASDSKLAAILGNAPLLVNSRHHQGIMAGDKSRLLRAVAFAPDGTVEAVEGIGHAWALAVQWHPEKRLDSYVHAPCKNLFRAFVAAAKDRR